MIIQIDDQHFNPEQVTRMEQSGNDTVINFSSGWEAYLLFKNWKMQDLAAEINRNIEEFHIDNYVKALKRFQTLGGLYDGKESLKTQSG